MSVNDDIELSVFIGYTQRCFCCPFTRINRFLRLLAITTVHTVTTATVIVTKPLPWPVNT